MKKITDIDAIYRCNGKKAIEKFFKRYPEHEETWRETFEYMLESGEQFFSDNKGVNGEDIEWSYALHLEVEEDYTYIALIERA